MTYGDRPRPEESRLRGDTGTTLYEDTIAGLLARTAAVRPEAEALVFREHGLRLTWGGFREAVDRLATGLLELGVARGDRVGIWSPNRPEWVLTQFATARIGAILVNVNPAYRLAEVEYALRHVGVRVLVTADDLWALALVVIGISIFASLLGIWKAMRVEPNKVLS